MTDAIELRAVLPALARRIALCAGLSYALAGCGSQEDALRQQVADLRYDVTLGKQHNDDLKYRMHLAEVRNRVLIDLVKGLTADPHAAANGASAPSELVRARESLAELDRDLGELTSTLRQSRDDMQALRNQRQALEEELDRATRAIEQARAEESAANQRAVAFREMLLHFRSMMAAGDLEIRVVNNRMVLQLPEPLLFDRGRADMKKQGRALLDKVAAVLIAVGDREFQIAGHTASAGADKGNYESEWHLSAARAVNVIRYLLARGVPKRQLSAAAYGDTMPLAVGSSDADRLNRRIEIVLMPRLDELPKLSTVDALVTQAEPGAVRTESAPTSTETPAETPAQAPPAEPAPAVNAAPTTSAPATSAPAANTPTTK
jgi:chemotaxis protein MotB